MRAAPYVFCFLIVTPVAAIAEPVAAIPVEQQPTVAFSIDELVRMSECQLVALYRSAEPGTVPTGYTPGRMISKPGSKTTVFMSRVTSRTVWQGKNFDDCGIMTNRMFGVRFIKGEVQSGESWIDGRPSIIIDYSPTSHLWRPYRDEIREICPGIYLGVMFKRDCPCPKVVTYFVLDARTGCCHGCGK